MIGAAIVAANQNYDNDFRTANVNSNMFNTAIDDNGYQRAYYSAEENPNKAPVFIVYLDAEINGKRSFIKGISPSTRKDGKQSYLQAVKSTVDAFLSSY